MGWVGKDVFSVGLSPSLFPLILYFFSLFLFLSIFLSLSLSPSLSLSLLLLLPLFLPPAQMKIPNMTLWCPRTLIDVSQLNNYYNQLALEVAYRSGYV